MKEALKEAEKGYEKGEVPVGAVLVCQNKIIARAHNQVEFLKDATAHAEMLCLKAGAVQLENWRLSKTTLYSTLEPCSMCAGALILSRVNTLAWGAQDLRHGADGSLFNILNKPHPIHELYVHRHILQEECSTLMRKFFKEVRNGKDF